MTNTIDVTCPTCGAAVNITGWDHGHRRGICTDCQDDITIVVHPTYSGPINRNAPLHPLVALVMEATA